VASGSRYPGGGVANAAPGRLGRHRAGNDTETRPANAGGSGPAATGAMLFTQSALEYAAQRRPGEALVVLQAGCATAGGDLDLDALRASGYGVTLTMLDDDNEVTRAAVAGRPDLRPAVLGELRAVPLVPRSADIVHCCLLLDRISHAELVLGRLVDALRPGGLLLLRTADRETAAGFLDRVLPRWLRGLAWHSLRPGEPGPYPAVYEQLTSARGIQLFAARHGLVISRREVCSRLDSRRRPVIRAARKLVAGATRGRLTAAHDELRYVVRKPEDRFARVL
jgi:SAM-dependent methyltransferase